MTPAPQEIQYHLSVWGGAVNLVRDTIGMRYAMINEFGLFRRTEAQPRIGEIIEPQEERR